MGMVGGQIIIIGLASRPLCRYFPILNPMYYRYSLRWQERPVCDLDFVKSLLELISSLTQKGLLD